MISHNIYDAKVVLEMKNSGAIKEVLFLTPDNTTDIEAFGLIYG